MAKVKTINFNDFLSGSYKQKSSKEVVYKVITAAGPALIMILPRAAAAAAIDGTFGNLHKAIMNGFDAGVVMVIIFAGAAWGLGHRGKAMEILIGVCCGYILARHAVDIRDFLKSI